MSDDYTPSAEVMQSARQLRDNVFRDPGIDSMTLSAGGRSVTIGRDVRRQTTPPVQEELMTATLTQPTVRQLITGGNPDAPAGPPTEDEFVSRAWLEADPRRTPDDEDAPHDDYRPAPDVQHIAEVLIAKHHRFMHLRDVRIDYRWKRRGGSAAGKATLGKCVKVSGLVKHYTDATWIVWLAADHALALDAYQLEALIFHELLHAETDEEGEKAIVRPHDFEGFACEIEEYGLWSQSAKQIAPSFRQSRMPLFGGGR